jgi:thioredoxin-dependent peroxiredoxin
MTSILNGTNLVGKSLPTIKTLIPNPTDFDTVSTTKFFKNKRVLVFAIPGAFTPTCSNKQLPDYIKAYSTIINHNIDAIYCISVNDAYVLKAWFDYNNVENIQFIADPLGDFTGGLGMLIEKNNIGLGLRSWRYAMVVNNNVIEAWFEESGISNNYDKDPYSATTPKAILEYLNN